MISERAISIRRMEDVDDTSIDILLSSEGKERGSTGRTPLSENRVLCLLSPVGQEMGQVVHKICERFAQLI
eukprot:m.29663 g.29663  ORF g.29663 m.29663 type:complete len:71 (-) comp6722_c0_seq1:518-730(-)